MRVWSQGLGKQELVLEFAKSNIVREEGKLYIRGIVQEPVNWQFEITIHAEDVPGFYHVLFSIPVLRFSLKNLGDLFKFINDKFIARRMGMKAEDKKPVESSHRGRAK
jgi:hypothetical protein